MRRADTIGGLTALRTQPLNVNHARLVVVYGRIRLRIIYAIRNLSVGAASRINIDILEICETQLSVRKQFIFLRIASICYFRHSFCALLTSGIVEAHNSSPLI
jgi:hypothetical protein